MVAPQKRIKKYYRSIKRFSAYYSQINSRSIIYCNNSIPKQIAITFDDGPHKIYTRQILSILDRYNVKATFFLSGNCIESEPEIAGEIFLKGHTIGNHSYSHVPFNSLAPLEVLSELEKTDTLIKAVTGGKNVKYYRPPYRISTDFYMGWIRKNHKYNVSWSFDTYDHEEGISSARILSNFLMTIKNGDVVLFHDTREVTVQTLEVLLPELIKAGFSFVKISL